MPTMALVGRRYRDDVTLPDAADTELKDPSACRRRRNRNGGLAGPNHGKFNKLPRPVLPAFGNRIVGESELEQIVVRHHPVDADDPRQLGLVGVGDVSRRTAASTACLIHVAHLE